MLWKGNFIKLHFKMASHILYKAEYIGYIENICELNVLRPCKSWLWCCLLNATCHTKIERSKAKKHGSCLTIYYKKSLLFIICFTAEGNRSNKTNQKTEVIWGKHKEVKQETKENGSSIDWTAAIRAESSRFSRACLCTLCTAAQWDATFSLFKLYSLLN